MDLDGFTFWTPRNDKSITPLDAAGVFIICRYKERNSLHMDFLFCASSDNMRTDAERIMTQEKIDGFEKPVVYLLHPISSPTERSALLNKVQSYGIPSR